MGEPPVPFLRVAGLEAWYGESHILHGVDFDVEKGGQRSDIDDVFEELALPRLGIFACANLRQRHAEHNDIAAQPRGRNRPRGIIE